MQDMLYCMIIYACIHICQHYSCYFLSEFTCFSENGISKKCIDQIVMWVGKRNPFGSVSLNVSPKDISEIVVGELTGMKSIDRFDDVLSSVSIQKSNIDDFLNGQVVVDDVEIVEFNSLISENVLVDFVKSFSPSSSDISDILISVHVSPAR